MPAPDVLGGQFQRRRRITPGSIHPMWSAHYGVGGFGYYYGDREGDEDDYGDGGDYGGEGGEGGGGEGY